MITPYLQFLTRLSVYSIIMGLLTLVIFLFIPGKYASPSIPFQFIYFYSVTAIVYFLLLKASEKSPGRFIARFMLVSFLKLLFYVAMLIVYLLVNKNDAIRFIIPYFILYILYTTFEVISFLRYIKNH